MNNAQTLISLAMLKVDLDSRQRDYVDYLSPFVVETLAAGQQSIVTDVLVADALLAKFRLKIPTKVVQLVLRRLKKRGYLTEQNKVFVVGSSLPNSSLEESRKTATLHMSSAVSAVIAEAKSVGRDWDENRAIDAITSFLGNFTVDCLRTFVFNTALPIVPEATSSEQYIVSRFIKAAKENNRAEFDSFIVLVKGLMYSNALLCPDLESLEKKFQDVSFYLDTPLVLNVLGLHGDDAKRAAVELVELLVKLKGTISMFSHTAEEVKAIIHAALVNYDNPHPLGKVSQEVQRTGIPKSELMLARDNLDDKLARYRVGITQTPEFLEAHQIDEIELERRLEDSIQYRATDALLNDVNSVRSIYSLRRGRQPRRLEDCVAVFVTTNAAFSRAAYELGKNHNSSREVSSVITAYSLSNIAWLKAPVETPNLPIRETMAFCYAALEPSPALFRKYVAAMDRLLESGEISARDHEILRLSQTAREDLMELTLGDEAALTGSSVANVLARVMEQLREEQRIEFQREKEKLKKDTEDAGREHLTEIARLHAEVRAANDQTERAKKELEARLDVDRSRQQRQVDAARRVARTIVLLLGVACVIGLLIGLVLSSGLVQVSGTLPQWLRIGMFFAICATLIWSLLNWIFGTSVKSLFVALEALLFRFLSRR